MKIRDLDETTKLLLFRAGVICRPPTKIPTAGDLERLREAHDAWEQAHAEEICENIFSALNDPSVRLAETEEECDGCDGTGLMEGWNRRDGNLCPKCKGAGCVPLPAVEVPKP